MMWVVGPCASFASPAPGRTWIGRDTHACSTQRRRASSLRTPRRACTQRTQGARKQRTCLLLLMCVPAASLPGRGSCTGDGARLLRCARGVECARACGAAPRASRGHWGLVRLLLSLGAACLLSSSSRFSLLAFLISHGTTEWAKAAHAHTPRSRCSRLRPALLNVEPNRARDCWQCAFR